MIMAPHAILQKKEKIGEIKFSNNFFVLFLHWNVKKTVILIKNHLNIQKLSFLLLFLI